MLFSELKSKEVVNLRDCRKMGHVTDFEFDECSGVIQKIIVPGIGGKNWKCLFGCDTEYAIAYQDIKQDRAGCDYGRCAVTQRSIRGAKNGRFPVTVLLSYRKLRFHTMIERSARMRVFLRFYQNDNAADIRVCYTEHKRNCVAGDTK